MADLFQLPKVMPLYQGAVMPGSKLYFYRTGTSTPQNTYTDSDLTTPHANPVVADANGVFAPIFLDPNLPDYRVTLTNSLDVVQSGYPVDDYPALSTGGSGILGVRAVTNTGTVDALVVTLANPPIYSYSDNLILFVQTTGFNTITNPTINVNGLGARTIYHATGAALSAGDLSGQKVLLVYNSLASRFDLLSPSYTNALVKSGAIKVQATSTGASVAGDLAVSGNIYNNGTQVIRSGTFTGTLTGMTTTITGTFNYSLVGNVASIWTISPVFGTSNSTEMTMTGVPSFLDPFTVNRAVNCSYIRDNGATNLVGVAIVSSGVIQFALSKTNIVTNYITQETSGFTASLQKGLSANWNITYTVNL